MRSKLFLAAAALCLAGCSKPAPEKFQVRFDTTKGNFTIEADRALSPRGADRFYQLVNEKFYDGARLYRVRPGFVVQWGIQADPNVHRKWSQAKISDDPVKHSNDRGYVSFATDGPNTRTTELFVNLVDNQRLDARGFSPFGKVIDGMNVVDSFYADYGEVAPRGPGVDQAKYEAQGEPYIQQSFPKLDQIKTARIVQ